MPHSYGHQELLRSRAEEHMTPSEQEMSVHIHIHTPSGV